MCTSLKFSNYAPISLLLIQGSTTALIEAAKKKYVDRRTNPSDIVGILAAAMSNQVAKVSHLHTTLIVELLVQTEKLPTSSSKLRNLLVIKWTNLGI